MIPATSPHLQPSGDSSAPCIGILADSPRLLNVIKYVLAENCLLISQVVDGSAYSFSAAETGALRLVILAVARPESEPLVMLGQAGLGCLVGVVPILLITERQFYPAPDSRIYHLDYPFPPDALKRMLQELIG
jgi:hypothetical protein